MPNAHAPSDATRAPTRRAACEIVVEGGMIEAACERHADPTIMAYAACMLCTGARPSLVIDGDFAHKRCHAEAVGS